MAKKNTSLIIAGLAAGAYAFLRKQENRDKAVAAFNSTKEKVNELLNQKATSDVDNTSPTYEAIPDTDSDTSYYLRDRRMIDEGAMTTVQYYNDDKQKEVDDHNDLEYFIEDKDMASEGAMTKVNYENEEAQHGNPAPKTAAPNVDYRADSDSTGTEEEGTSEFIRDRDMISEGAGTTVQYYNEEQEKQDKKS